MFLKYVQKHIAGILQTLITEFQPLILGAGFDFATGTPAAGRFPLATETFQFFRRDFLAGFLGTSSCQSGKGRLVTCGIGDINIAFPAKTAASSL